MSDGTQTTGLAVKIIMGLMSLLTSIAMAAAGWSFSASQDNTATIKDAIAARELRDSAHDAEMKMIAYKLTQLSADKDLDTEQSRRLTELRATDKKHWKILNWVKSQINMQRADAGKPLVEWPDLGE
jgi:hypothetical protein